MFLQKGLQDSTKPVTTVEKQDFNPLIQLKEL